MDQAQIVMLQAQASNPRMAHHAWAPGATSARVSDKGLHGAALRRDAHAHQKFLTAVWSRGRGPVHQHLLSTHSLGPAKWWWIRRGTAAFALPLPLSIVRERVPD